MADSVSSLGRRSVNFISGMASAVQPALRARVDRLRERHINCGEVPIGESVGGFFEEVQKDNMEKL